MAIEKNITNGSEFIFNAWNGTAGYTLDLNLDTLLGNWIGTDPRGPQTAQQTLDAAAVPANQYNASGVLFDGALTDFATAFGANPTGVEWSLVAYDNSGVSRVIVTSDAAASAVASSNDQVKNLANTLDNMATQVNGRLATADEDTYAITTSTDGAAYAGQFGATYQGNVFDTTNTLGATSSLYMVAQSSSNANDANQDGLVKQIATAGGVNLTATTYEANGVWNLRIEAAGATDGTIAGGDPVVPVVFNSLFAQTDLTAINAIPGTNEYLLVGKNAVNERVDGSKPITFTDGTISLEDLISANSAKVDFVPTFGFSGDGTLSVYEGTVASLEYQFFGTVSGESVIGAETNDFIALFNGDDAAQGGAGDDVLDGGLGSNFLTGGAGNDVFFLDGRATGDTTWSTITDFTAGDSVNIWGWVAGTSQLLLTQESNGAAGFQGVTNHYDLNGDNLIDTSITFTGLTAVPTNSPEVVADNGYLLFTA